MLTAHDRVTALNLNAVVFAHAMPECALAGAKYHAKRTCNYRFSLASPGIGHQAARFVHRVEVNNQQSHHPVD